MTETPDPQTTPPATPPETPAKTKRTRKAAAPAPAAKAKPEARSLYLPALPEGFEYTTITATGANGETVTISAAAGPDDAVGSANLAFEGSGLSRSHAYSDMKAAITAGAKAAKSMAKIAEREAELAKVREEAFDL